MNERTLQLEGLVKRHAGASRPTLDGLDLEVRDGTILVLLGTSGAGKTTLLRIVAGLEEADAGRVLLGEKVLSDPHPRIPPEERGIGLVFQHLELWPHMTVAENIAFGLPGRPKGKKASAHPRVKDLAERVGLEAMLDRSPGTLSGGERQRVAIARTLAPGPAVTLYDEPLANLDPDRRIDLRRKIRSLCRDEGSTLLYVTHDAEEAMAVGDEIAVLHRGRVIDRGDPERLYRRPTSEAGARALGPVTVLPARSSHGRVETEIGAFEIEDGAPDHGAFALLRPESVRIEPRPDGAAHVVECRPAGRAWRVRAVVGEHAIEGWSDTRVGAGERVGFQAAGSAVLVGEEEI